MTSDRSILIRSKQSLHQTPTGGERLMRTLALALHERGWTVDIICPEPVDGDLSTDLPVELHTFPYPTPTTLVGRLVDSIRGRKTFERLVANREYDVYLDSVANLPFYPGHFLVPEETTNAMYIHSFFGSAAWDVFSPIKAAGSVVIERTLSLLSDPEFVCNGPSTERRVREWTGSRRTHVLRPCIDLEEFTYQFDPDSRTVAYLGRLAIEKNVDWLLRSWAAIESDERFEEFELAVGGSGYQEAELRALAADLGLERVRFVGYKDGEEKRAFLRDAAVLVFPSQMEGYGIVGLEAMASGTPVVASAAPGIRDYLVDGESGILVDLNDDDALTRGLKRALEDPEKLRPLAERGRTVAEAHGYEAFREAAAELFTALADA